MRTNIDIDVKLKPMVDALKEILVTDNLAYIVRLAIVNLYQKNLHQNIDTSILSDISSIPTVNLPGMNERVVKTQMERWQLSAEEYSAIVQKTINDFAASGGQMKNPENVIWKACSRYAHERDIQKKAAAAQTATPSDGSAEQPKVKPDGSLENIYDLQERLG